MTILIKQVIEMVWDLIFIGTVYEWKTQGDNCAECDALDGQVFTEGSEPSSHPNCDCYLVPSTEYELVDLGDYEPGEARIFAFTDREGKKLVSSEGLGPSASPLLAENPTPTSYSNYQLDRL